MPFLLALAFVASPPAAGMIVRERTDPITDDIEAYASITEGRSALTIGCKKSNTPGMRVVVTFDEYLGRSHTNSGWELAVHRFDRDEPVSLMWFYFGRMIALTEDPKEIRTFVSRMLSASKVSFRAQTYKGQVADTTFTIGDVRDSLRRVFSACGEGEEWAIIVDEASEAPQP